jgi:hypothetical protein
MRDAGDGLSPQSNDYNLAIWQGRIAAAARHGGGLDVFKAALETVVQSVPPPFYAIAKDGIWGAAERHLADIHGFGILDAIYFATFPEDAERSSNSSTSNSQLDTETVKTDDRNVIAAEIERLSKLPPMEYEHERKRAAEKLGISRVSVLDDAVRAARTENGATGRQGRKPSITEAEPWPEPVNLADTLDKAVAAYSRYLILPRGGAEKMALWSMGTHCFQEFQIFPRLAVTSPVKECAKSLLLRVLKSTSARPVIMTNANIAPLFRMISAHRPSIFLDEADNYLSDKPDLLALLNDGYAAGGRIWRCEGENNEVKEFDVFAPVAIAMINRPPTTLLSRSIEIRMQRKGPGETTANFRGDRADPVLAEIQRKFARIAVDHAGALRLTDPNMGSLFNRDADNWRSMFAVAELAGEDWPRRVRELAQDAVTSRAEQSTKEQLLADMLSAFQAKSTDRLSSEDAIEYLTGLDDRPWPEWKIGKPLSKSGLARLLGTFGILSGTVRLADGRTLKGYKREDFEKVFELYLPPQTDTPSQANNGGHCDASRNVTRAEQVTPCETSQANNDGHCDGGTDQEPWKIEL